MEYISQTHAGSDYRPRNLFNSENTVSKNLNSPNEAIDHMNEAANDIDIVLGVGWSR